jgi:hypothetical protein
MSFTGLIRRGPSLTEEASHLLAGLGSSSSEIASSLESAGVKGSPRRPDSCALARYLSAVMASDPGVRRVLVNADRLVIEPARRWHRRKSVALPEPARRFLVAFDSICFPSLLEDRADAGASSDASFPG